jgi:hypothetical protein
MGITERVDRMVVRVETPSRSVWAQMHGRSDIVIRFAPGFFRRAKARELQTQLEQLGRLLWAAWMREYHAIVSAEHHQIYQEKRPVAERDVEFVRKRANLIAHGRSSDGRIRVAVRGMREWKVWVATEAKSISEAEFTKQAAIAARALIDDQRMKIRELKVTTFDPRFVADFQG